MEIQDFFFFLTYDEESWENHSKYAVVGTVGAKTASGDKYLKMWRALNCSCGNAGLVHMMMILKL